MLRPAILLLVSLLAVAGCAPSTGVQSPTAVPRAPREPSDNAAGTRPDRVRSEVFLQGLQLPSALTFAPDGRLFLVEVNAGRVRVASNGQLQSNPVATFPVQQASESGLLGLALDPDFATNHYVYVYYSEADPSRPQLGVRNRVIRFVERDGTAGEMTPILDDLPVNAEGALDAHQGGAMIFGPDRKLYVTVGDVGRPDLAQDPASLAGKVLRVNSDGTVPADNPVPGSPVYAMGLRNPWGLAVHPKTGEIYVTDNGNKAHDRIVLLQAGANYGWPVVEVVAEESRFDAAVWDSGDSPDSRNGMVGLTFYDGTVFPNYNGSLLFCAFRTGKLRRLVLTEPGFERAVSQQRIEAECRLGITVGPDHALYTSSIDKVYRLTRR